MLISYFFINFQDLGCSFLAPLNERDYRLLLSAFISYFFPFIQEFDLIYAIID